MLQSDSGLCPGGVCLLDGIKDLKHRIQLRDPNGCAAKRTGSTESESTALARSECSMQTDHTPQKGRSDESDVLHVDDQFRFDQSAGEVCRDIQMIKHVF